MPAGLERAGDRAPRPGASFQPRKLTGPPRAHAVANDNAMPVETKSRTPCDHRGMVELIDSHCHLDAPEFAADRDQALERARDAGVRIQVLPAISANTWPTLRALCIEHADLYPAYGLHPLYLDRHRAEHLDLLRDWLHRERPIAVGECGLDLWLEGLDQEAQLTYLLAQLRLARDFDLPVILHARKAYDQVAAALRRIGGLRGVVHSFAGSQVQAEQFWKLGFHLGIGGPVTYPRARRLRRLVATMPIERLLLETDSPDQPLCGRQGHRNEPAFLPQVLAVVARLREQAPEAVAHSTSLNARRLFGLR